MRKLMAIVIMILLLPACSPNFNLFRDSSDPLKERVISGSGADKVLMIPVAGFISDAPRSDLLSSAPSMVQDVVSQLRLAEKDDKVKAVVLKIDSPGGATTASDILYHEISEFKKKTGKKVVAVFMNVAASGGYYMALPADRIVAHPTSVTGSVGVIMIQPEFMGIMEKVGVGVNVVKSGRNKDMGSPFRKPTDEEARILDGVVADLAGQFAGHVAEHRKLDEKAMEQVKTARIFVAAEAKELGLVDEIGYLPGAIETAKSLAGADKDAKVIVYRRTKFANDTVYNMPAASSRESRASLVSVDLLPPLHSLAPGFYYLWTPVAGN